VIGQLLAERGLLRGLFAGVTARVMGVAPGSAMLMSCYETGKRFSLRDDATR